MSAPPQVYRAYKFVARKGTSNVSNLAAIMQVNRATMLSRFYLDSLFAVKGQDGTDGVIGLVRIGGENEKMHNTTTRGGVGRARLSDGDYRMLNDAGLNTKGIVLSASIPNQQGHVSAVTGEIRFKSAYYIASANTQYGVKYRQDFDSWQELYAEQSLNANSEVTLTFKFPTLRPNTGLDVRPFIRNSEGEYVFSDLYSTIFRESIMMSYDISVQAFLCNIVKDIQIFPDSDIISTRTKFYYDVMLTIPADTGGYSDGVWYYDYRSEGVFEMASCAEPPRRNEVEYINFSEDRGTACTFFGSAGAIYYEQRGSEVYYFTSFSPMDDARAPAGFYSYEDDVTRKVIQVGSNGLEISNTNC